MSAPVSKSSLGAQVARALAMGAAALSLAWGVALSEALVAAIVGAALGVAFGEWLGRSRLRLPVALGVVALGGVAAMALARLMVDTRSLPLLLGPVRALTLAAALRFFTAALTGSAFLRVLAVRRQIFAVLELFVVAAAIPVVFSAHREGVIARPLWLSDFAWQRGIDPTQIFLGVGALAVAILALLLLVEAKRGRAFSSFVLLLLASIAAVVMLPLLGLPRAEPPPGLGDSGKGDAGAETEAGTGTDAGTDAEAEAEADAGADAEAEAGSEAGADAGADAAAGAEAGADAGAGTDAGADGGSPVAPSEHLDDARSNTDDSGQVPVAVVVLDDDYEPPSEGFYFRQEAWSQFNGARLVPARRDDLDRDIASTFPVIPIELPAPPEQGRDRVRATVALLVEHTEPFALESPIRLLPARNPNTTRFVRAYRFESLAQRLAYGELLGRNAGDPSWSAEILAHYLVTPPDPRYAELARSIEALVPADKKGDAFATALTVKLYLDDRFIYSMKHKHDGKADPTADFLFGDRTGYCVHFAHAAVYLWRALGIPARIGTGYRVADDQRRGGSTIVVREVDAHAWPELYLEGLGWTVLDIAAKTTLDPEPPPMDPELSRLLGEMVRQTPPDPEDTAVTRSLSWLPDAHALARFLGLALALVLAVLYTLKVARRLAPFVAAPRKLPRVGYRAALDRLAEVGLCRLPGESREAFAARVAMLTPAFETLTAIHLAAALGDPARERSNREFEACRAALRTQRAEIGRGIRLWRRLLGALDPTSFLRSR